MQKTAELTIAIGSEKCSNLSQVPAEPQEPDDAGEREWLDRKRYYSDRYLYDDRT